MMRGVPAGAAPRCRLPCAPGRREGAAAEPSSAGIPFLSRGALEPPLWTEGSACARNFLVTERSGVSSAPTLSPVPKSRVFVPGFVTRGVTGAVRGLERYKR